MNIAIVGAGIAGLSCAYEFEKHGITPVIFEKHKRIGEDVDFNTATLKLFDRMYKDPLKYLKKEYNINLKPLNILKNILMFSPTKQTTITGTNGYIFCRGDCDHSLENQLKSHVRSPINFDKNISIENIKNKYDYVIDGTGTLDYPNKLGIVTPYLNAFARIAVVSGNFQSNTITMWVNTDYCKKSFCYLLPHSSSKACLVVTVDNITHPELDYYWEKFIYEEKINNVIIKTFDVKHQVGMLLPHKIFNIYFVGKAGGFIDSVLGFGMTNSIESGALAARAIINKTDYETDAKPISDYLRKKYEYRKLLNKFDNKDFDILIETLGLPVIRELVYKNPFVKVTQGTFAAKFINKIKK